MQRTANEYAEERRIYKDLISKNNNVDILNSASRILQCWSYYVKINSARHEFLGRRPCIDPICCNSCMVLSMYFRLVLANSLFSLRDINLTLKLLPPRRHVVWRDSVGVKSSGSGLKIRVPRYFLSELSLVVTPYWRAPKRAKQLSMATIPLCFESFRCGVDVL